MAWPLYVAFVSPMPIVVPGVTLVSVMPYANKYDAAGTQPWPVAFTESKLSVTVPARADAAATIAMTNAVTTSRTRRAVSANHTHASTPTTGPMTRRNAHLCGRAMRPIDTRRPDQTSGVNGVRVLV